LANKKRVLEKLKKKVQKHGVITAEYVGNMGGKTCYCAVGHLMTLCGVDMEEVKMMYNSDVIGVFENSNRRKLIQPMLDEGFTMSDLRRLQIINDDSGNFTRKKDVLEEIDIMIQELEGKRIESEHWY